MLDVRCCSLCRIKKIYILIYSEKFHWESTSLLRDKYASCLELRAMSSASECAPCTIISVFILVRITLPCRLLLYHTVRGSMDQNLLNEKEAGEAELGSCLLKLSFSM